MSAKQMCFKGFLGRSPFDDMELLLRSSDMEFLLLHSKEMQAQYPGKISRTEVRASI